MGLGSTLLIPLWIPHKGSARNFLSQPGNAPQEEKCFRDVRAQALHLKAPRLSWTQGIRARDWSYTTARQGHSFRYSAVSATVRHFTEIKASCCLIGIHRAPLLWWTLPDRIFGHGGAGAWRGCNRDAMNTVCSHAVCMWRFKFVILWMHVVQFSYMFASFLKHRIKMQRLSLIFQERK